MLHAAIQLDDLRIPPANQLEALKHVLRFKPHDSVCCVCFVNERSISDHCSVPTVPL